MAVVGITGGIGSGKSAATDHFASLGVTVVDADLAARVIMRQGGSALAAVAAHFGDDILLADGSLDRPALRARVFADPAQRLWLERLTHPLIGQQIVTELQASRSVYSILASPLLLETSQKELCDCVVVVDVAESVQLQRTMARDGNDEQQVQRIMAAQMSRSERLALADEVLDNSGSPAQLQTAVEQMHRRFLHRFS